MKTYIGISPNTPTVVFRNSSFSAGSVGLIEIGSHNSTGILGNHFIGSVSTSSNYNNHFIIQQRTSLTGYEERFRISSSGNVGIGTGTPGAKLQVAGATGQTVRIENTSSALTTNTLIGSYDFYANDTSTGGIGITGFVSSYAEESFGIASYLSFGTRPITGGNALERLRITSSGNVGIGTTLPVNKFNVVDNINLNTWNTSAGGTLTNASIENLDVSSGSAAVLQIIHNQHASVRLAATRKDATNYWESNFSIAVRGADANMFEAMRITSAGNVGIGTSSPTRKLHTYGSGTSLKIEGSGTNTYMQLACNSQTNTDSGYIGYDSNYNMLFLIRDSEKMRLDSSGNVGIGTSSPASKLHVDAGVVPYSYNVAARIYVTNNNAYSPASYYGINTIYVQNNSTTAGSATGISFGTVGSGSGSVATIGAVATNNSGYGSALVFQTRDTSANDAERLRIDSSGNIGVGLTTTTYKINVSGAYLYFEGNGYGQNGILEKSPWGDHRFALRWSGGGTTDICGMDNTTDGVRILSTSFYNAGTTTLGNVMAEFQHGGSCYRQGNLSTWNTTSDIRVKKDFTEISGLDKILNLHPVEFSYIDEFCDSKNIDKNKRDVGFIAQEFKEVFPSSVNESIDEEGPTVFGEVSIDNILTMEPSIITPHLVKSIQEQQIIINSLQDRITILESKN